MRIKKRLLRPERARCVPGHFSWVDHRLVRDRVVQRCTPDALALYLLLVTVGDADGLSFYSDATICRLVSMDASALREAKRSGCWFLLSSLRWNRRGFQRSGRIRHRRWVRF